MHWLSDMLRGRSDLPLQKDPAARFLPWIMAAMVYLAMLALAVALALNGAVGRWSERQQSTLTVQLPAAAPPARLAAVLRVLRGTEGVGVARVLTRREIAVLLSPWLGQGVLTEGLPDDLPLPTLIDVTLKRGADLDVAKLTTRLHAVAPGAEIDDHKAWLDRLARLARSVQLVAALVVVLTVAAAALAVIFVTRTGLAIHHEVIKVLHMMGAHDSYIARQFQRRALLLSLRGCAAGLAVAWLTLLGLGRLAEGVRGPMVPDLAIGFLGWAAIVMLAVVAAAIATVTARLTVLRVLARMP